MQLLGSSSLNVNIKQKLSWILVCNHYFTLFLVIDHNKNPRLTKTLILNFMSYFFFHFRFEITNEIPSHPAGSFHYPEKSSLPFIATFSFVKEKEYELSEVFNFNFKRNNPKNNNIDNASSKTKVNKYMYEVDNNENIDNSIVKFVPTGDENILRVLEKPTPPCTCDETYIHLCSCKNFAKIVPNPKNYTPTPAPSIKTTPKPVVEIKNKR